MKKTMLFGCEVLVSLMLVAGTVSAQDAAKSADASKLVYADFQNPQSGRPEAVAVEWFG